MNFLSDVGVTVIAVNTKELLVGTDAPQSEVSNFRSYGIAIAK